jgi:thiol reductant ABC exporter CydD subunit
VIGATRHLGDDGDVRAVDPRLLQHGRATRAYLALSVALGTGTAFLVIAQAWLLATVVAGAFAQGKELGQLRTPVEMLLSVVFLRAVLAWTSDVTANRCSAQVKSELRRALVERVAVLGPDGLVVRRTGDVAALATRGVDALDGYYSRYLPQLVLAAIVPLTVLAAVVTLDWVSAAIMAVTLPLVPVFMALVGMATRRHTDRQFRTLQRLSGHFLDVVAGLATLKVFGRSKAQTQTIRDVTDSYRRTTMATLRLTFLSSLVLELLASLSVALVAVSVGLRLLGGHLDLRTSLFVLVLAPEAYLPLRLVGANFHASAEGMSAAEQVFGVVDEPLPPRGTRTDVPDPATSELLVDNLHVTYPGRDRPALDGVSLAVEPGEVVAVTGPSGCGKSTLLGVLLGLVESQAGSVTVNGIELASLDPDAWRARVAWVPQRPHLFAASIADNVCLGCPNADAGDVLRAVAGAGLADLVARLPRGLDTPIGEGGAGLSAGERQRVALARAFLRDAPLLLLDEPTANLDGETEAGVLEAVFDLTRGRTVVLVAHRPALLVLADRVIDLTSAGVSA